MSVSTASRWEAEDCSKSSAIIGGLMTYFSRFYTPSKRSFLLGYLAAVTAGLLLLGMTEGCGSNPSSSAATTAGTTMLPKRAFVSNQAGNVLQIVDAAKDILNSATVVPVGFAPTLLVTASSLHETVVVNFGDHTLSLVDNTKESTVAQVTLPESTDTIALSPDGKTAYTTGNNLGTVFVVDNIAGKVTSVCPVATPACIPAARRLVLSSSGAKLLVFSDGSDSINIVNSGGTDKTPVQVGGLDRPVFGVFNSDGSRAFILNCGAECGGKTASVSVLDTSTNKIQGAPIPVSGATVGLLDGSNLYVAGTAAGAGLLDVIDTGSLAVTTKAVPITDGYHQLMSLGPNNRLFVGARTCTNSADLAVASKGCLSIYNTSTKAAKIPVSPAGKSRGDVTGIEPISSRSVVYVCEAGEVQIFETSTDALQATQIDIVGKAFDVREVK